ncbi:MAG: Holliday junction branch migration protein RuvA [Fimbriimonadaceae bacterium]|nr:Holliday junction branch migration protein RuvA [Fimbriimonadaceae bacterium]
MIARLRGEVLESWGNSLVVDCAGVGYEVVVPESVLAEMGIVGAKIDLFVRQIVREDDLSLYGFQNKEQRALFDLLREVKGCGSRISLNAIGTLGERGTVEAIARQDAKALALTPGIGARLAERIIVELKDKVGGLHLASLAASQGPNPTQSQPNQDLVEALVSLGYRRPEAESAAQLASEQDGSFEDRLRFALRSLSR